MTQDLQACFRAMFTESFRKLVISKCRDRAGDLKKVEATPYRDGFQFTRYQGAQVFHRNVSYTEEAVAVCCEYLRDHFLQANAWDGDYEYSLMVSKGGKVSFARRANKAPAPAARMEHDRRKKYILEEGTIVPPLADMGVFTVDGRVVKSKYDKFRQINRFLELIDDIVKDDSVKDAEGPLNIIDFGCGKSYLTFVLYYYFTFIRQLEVHITGLDLKADVIEACNHTARKYGWDRLHFEAGDIHGYSPACPVDMVISLHACDTATDYALYNAIRWGAKYIFAVPCCQHELNAQMASDSFSLFTRYGVVQERLAALTTDAVRANLLEHCGYRTQLLEFVDLAHTPKNLLLRAVKGNRRAAGDSPALREVLAVMEEFHLEPALYRLLTEKDGA